MLDIRQIRHDADAVKRALARRSEDLPGQIDELLREDEAWRRTLGRVNDLKAERNDASKRIGQLKRAGEPADELIAAMRDVGARIATLEEAVRTHEARIRDILLRVPNVPLDEVPEGGEGANCVVSTWGEPPDLGFRPRPHWELGEALGILDLARGSKISGSGFPVLRGAGARLQRGLIDFFLDVHTREHGYQELRVPYLVTRETLTGTGQLPKFAEESYQTERDDLWLIPTA